MRFKAKVRKVGGSYVVTVPQPYVSNGIIGEGCEYNFDILDV